MMWRSLLFVPGRLRFEHLQGDVTIDRPLLRSEHNSHAAFAKHFGISHSAAAVLLAGDRTSRGAHLIC